METQRKNEVVAGHVDLMLYGGFCPSDGMEEGLFVPDAADGSLPLSADTTAVALRKVHHYLGHNGGSGIRISEIWRLVDSESEAHELLEFAGQIFPGAEEIIELHGIRNGEIKFSRKIRFQGYGKESEQKIAEKLAEKHRNVTREVVAEKGYNPEEFSDDWLKAYNEKLYLEAMSFENQKPAE